MIAGAHVVETVIEIRNHPRQHIKPAGRAFRVRSHRDMLRQPQRFHQRHEIDLIFF